MRQRRSRKTVPIAATNFEIGMTTTTRRWLTLTLLALINALMVFDRIALIVAIPIIKAEFHLTLVDTTILISAVMWSYGLLQIPAGWCVSRFGAKRMMLAALALWSAATIVTPLAHSFLALVALRSLLGVGQSPDWPASVATIRTWFDPMQRSRGTATLLAGQYLGVALAAPVTAAIVAKAGWQLPFYLYGVVGLILTVLWFVFFREREEDAYVRHERRKIQTRQLVESLLHSPQFWALGGIYACVSFTACFINYLLPHYLIEQRHLDYQLMGWLVGMPSVFLWGAAFVAGPISDGLLRTTGSVWAARVPLGCLGCVVAGLATGATDWFQGVGPMTVCLCLSFVGVGFAQVALWSVVQDLSGSYTGVLTGWAAAWGNLAAAAGPIVIAEVVQHTGSWRIGLSLPILAGALGAILVRASKPDMPIKIAPVER